MSRTAARPSEQLSLFPEAVAAARRPHYPACVMRITAAMSRPDAHWTWWVRACVGVYGQEPLR